MAAFQLEQSNQTDIAPGYFKPVSVNVARGQEPIFPYGLLMRRLNSKVLVNLNNLSGIPAPSKRFAFALRAKDPLLHVAFPDVKCY